MRVDDNVANLMPGMAVTSEIKTGSRQVITFLLSPLLRYGYDSQREQRATANHCPELIDGPWSC